MIDILTCDLESVEDTATFLVKGTYNNAPFLGRVEVKIDDLEEIDYEPLSGEDLNTVDPLALEELRDELTDFEEFQSVYSTINKE